MVAVNQSAWGLPGKPGEVEDPGSSGVQCWTARTLAWNQTLQRQLLRHPAPGGQGRQRRQGTSPWKTTATCVPSLRHIIALLRGPHLHYTRICPAAGFPDTRLDLHSDHQHGLLKRQESQASMWSMWRWRELVGYSALHVPENQGQTNMIRSEDPHSLMLLCAEIF